MADKTLLLKNADLLCTMKLRDAGSGQSAAHVGRPGDHCGAEIKNGGIFARNGSSKPLAIQTLYRLMLIR